MRGGAYAGDVRGSLPVSGRLRCRHTTCDNRLVAPVPLHEIAHLSAEPCLLGPGGQAVPRQLRASGPLGILLAGGLGQSPSFLFAVPPTDGIAAIGGLVRPAGVAARLGLRGCGPRPRLAAALHGSQGAGSARRAAGGGAHGLHRPVPGVDGGGTPVEQRGASGAACPLIAFLRLGDRASACALRPRLGASGRLGRRSASGSSDNLGTRVRSACRLHRPGCSELVRGPGPRAADFA